ncbi:MAG: phosphotriesterase-related protein [SAR202 cluster bacterium]|nr:aryldialkylphosphatase [Chloroflexota bacterium]MDP6421445.1 phosphotriesterase-related protein [SAR202 cluster bacterium]MDP6664821.1 phosphotriesterase-related protein [SAR202 cluster bacterium]MDP6799265.1 phosphotriesterase-related protein [SAR202 cluster bacterium]MQG58549.1 phosphotriesterase-related protein [SAR202 cluster bacterium]
MTDNSMRGKAQTVLGPVDAGDLGPTMTHEHLFIDFRIMFNPPADATIQDRAMQAITLENVGWVRYNQYTSLDNLMVLEEDVAIDEARLFKRVGGGTIVDATTIGIGRDPLALARIARDVGINIVMGAGFYVDPVHPDDMDDRSEDDLARQIIADIQDGVGDTGVKAGIIGEIGCSWPLTDNERKVLRAASIAQKETGASILIHPGRDEGAPSEIIEVLAESGADVSRVIMGHLDRTVADFDNLRRLASTGCYLEWDLFGNESSYYPLSDIDMPSDAQRMDTIKRIIESEGCGERVVIAHDICTKHRLVKYGGHGYGHILENIVPRMRRKGFTEEQVHAITAGNPASVLSFV